jgi:hypothetical protein
MSHVVITVQVRRSRQLTTGMVQGRCGQLISNSLPSGSFIPTA